jgi:hypothetical protein
VQPLEPVFPGFLNSQMEVDISTQSHNSAQILRKNHWEEHGNKLIRAIKRIIPASGPGICVYIKNLFVNNFHKQQQGIIFLSKAIYYNGRSYAKNQIMGSI